MSIAMVSGLARGQMRRERVRALAVAVELVNKGHEVVIFWTPYDNPAESGRKREIEGVRIVNVDVGEKPTLRHVPLVVKRLCKAIGEYSPDVVHVFKPKGYAGAACAWLLMKGCRS